MEISLAVVHLSFNKFIYIKTREMSGISSPFNAPKYVQSRFLAVKDDSFKNKLNEISKFMCFTLKL